MKNGKKLWLAAGVLAGALSQPVWAATDDEIAQLRQQIEDLDQKIRVLQRQQEIDKENAEAKKKDTPVVVLDKKGFALQSGDKESELRINGYIQADYRTYSYIGSPVDNFLIRRARLAITGKFGKYFSFNLTPSWDNNAAALQDAYIDANFYDWFKVRAGQFKVPFGLERLQSSANTSFVETAFTTGLTPNYEDGVQLFGTVLNGTTDYQLAVVNGNSLGGGAATSSAGTLGDNNSSKGWAARVFASPFKNGGEDALKGLGVGIAYEQAEAGNITAGVISVTPATVAPFAYLGNTIPGSDIRRWSPQAYWYYGPFGFLGEYVDVKQDVTRTAGALTNTRTLDSDAWQTLFSWVITGDDAGYTGVKPKKPFRIGSDGFGAVELVARYNVYDLDDASFVGAPGAATQTQIFNTALASPAAAVGKARDLGIGINWYLTGNYKIQTSYDVTTFDGAAGVFNATTNTITDRGTERVLFTRFQIGW